MKKKRAFKILAIAMLVGVCLSLVPMAAFAADVSPGMLLGIRNMSITPDFASLCTGGNGMLGSDEPIGLTYVTSPDYDGPGAIKFTSAGQTFYGITYDYIGLKPYECILVYSDFGDGDSMWLDDRYRLVDFRSATVADEFIVNWVMNNSISASAAFTEGYNAGYLAGSNSIEQYDKGYNDGYSEGYNKGQASDGRYDEGYNTGYQDGLVSSETQSFGQNLLGDTLSAPMKALNSFVIYQAPNGTTITLGLVLGAVIGFTIFMAFLKMFAGG